MSEYKCDGGCGNWSFPYHTCYACMMKERAENPYFRRTTPDGDRREYVPAAPARRSEGQRVERCPLVGRITS